MKSLFPLLGLLVGLNPIACSGGSGATGDNSGGSPAGSSAGSHGNPGGAGGASGGSTAAGASGNTSAGTSAMGGGSAAGASGGGANGAGAAASAGTGGGGPVMCPTSAPFDAEAPGVREQCTRKVYVAAGMAVRRIVAFDAAKDFAHQVLDAQDGKGQDEHQIASVAVGKGVIVATGDSGVLTSTDGETWTAITTLPNRIHASRVVFALDRFFVVGSNGTWTSSDAISWTGAQNDELLPGNVKASFTGHVGAAAAGGGKVVFGGDNSVIRVFDGNNWLDGKVGNFNGWLSNVAFGGDRFVVTGDACCNAPLPNSEGLSATSTDALAWSNLVTNATPGVSSRRFGALLWAGDHFYATGTQYGNTGYTSPDGAQWTEVKLDHNIGSAVYYEGEYFGSNGTSLFTSADGVKWSAVLTGVDSDYSLGALAIGRILKK